MLTRAPVSVVMVMTPRSATIPLKLMVPDTGATRRSLEASRSSPRWPGPQGVEGAWKSLNTSLGPSVGHSQVGSGGGGNSRDRATKVARTLSMTAV
jgi:hypothetical protein